MFSANTCQQRSPDSYLAESEEEVSNILNPKLGDIAVIATEDGTATFRLRDGSDYVVDGVDYLESNSCEHVWVRSGPEGEFSGAITAARINALIANGRPVILPEGTFEMDAAIALSRDYDIQGLGMGRTILDFTSGPAATAMYGTGSLTVLPALSGAVAKGQTTITFAAPHGLVDNDFFVIENTTDFSFSLARAIYHDGEWCEVATVVSPTQVTITQPTYSAYSGGSISVWKLNPIRGRIKGVTMKFRTGLGANMAGIQVSLGRDLIFEELDLSGSQYTNLFIDRSVRFRAENCEFFDNQSTIGNNYGIAVANSQHFQIINCCGATLRHVVTIGGGVADGSVPNRDFQIEGGDYSTLGTSWAVDVHGNAEWYQINGVNAPGGLGLGGDNASIVGGNYGNGNINGTAIVFAEVCGLNFNLDGVNIYASRHFNNGLISCYARSGHNRKSVLSMTGLKINMGEFASTSYPSGTIAAIELGVDGVLANDDITVNIDGGTVSTENGTIGPLYALQYISDITAGVPSGIRRINIKGLIAPKCGLLFSGDCEQVIVEGCILPDSYQSGIRVSDKGAVVAYSPQLWIFRNNNVTGAQRDGIGFGGDTSYSDVIMEDNLAFNCGQEASALYYSIRIDGVRNLFLTENSVGDIQSPPTQAGTYSLSNYTSVKDVRQNNIGSNLNPSLIRLIDGSGDFMDDPPFDGPQWNYVVSGFEWGAAGASATIPYLFRRDANAFIQWQFQNKIALGNTSAGMGITVIGGAVGNSSSVSVFAYAQDGGPAHLQGKSGILANPDADALVLSAEGASQTIDAYTKGTTRSFRVNHPAAAGHLGILTYDFDSSLEQRLKVGANGTGPGGVGRAVYVDNI